MMNIYFLLFTYCFCIAISGHFAHSEEKPGLDSDCYEVLALVTNIHVHSDVGNHEWRVFELDESSSVAFNPIRLIITLFAKQTGETKVKELGRVSGNVETKYDGTTLLIVAVSDIVDGNGAIHPEGSTLFEVTVDRDSVVSIKKRNSPGK